MNLNIGGTTINALTPTNVPVDADLGLSVLGLADVEVGVTGNVGVFQTSGSDFGPNGIRTTILEVNLALSAVVDLPLTPPTTIANLGVINIELAVADARLSNLQEDPTNTPTAVSDTPTATNTSVVPPTVVPPATATATSTSGAGTPTATSTPPAGSTATSTPPPGSTATSTPPPGSTATSTPPPGSTATSTPPPGSTATSTPEPGATATNTPEPGATATNTAAPTNTPPPGSTATSTPAPGATNTPTGGSQPPAGPGEPPGGQQPPAGPGGPPAGVPTPSAPNTGAGMAGDAMMPLPVVFGLALLALSAGLMVMVARRTAK